jgi:Polyprenyl synthetase
MQGSILEKVVKRISSTINELELVEDYRELLLSVVLRSARLNQTRDASTLPAFFLPELWCTGLGGNGDQAIGVTAVWFLLQLAAYWLDKVEDQELESTALAYLGPGAVSNLTTGLIFLAQMVLNRLDVDDEIDSSIAAELRVMFSESILSVCGGQHIDLMTHICNLNDVWISFERKSGQFFALACFAGARLATNNPMQLKASTDYGNNLGILLQIADEREDLVGDQPEAWTRSVIFRAYQHEVIESSLIQRDANISSSANSFHSGLHVYLAMHSRSLRDSGVAAIDRIEANLTTKDELTRLLSQSAGLPV